MAKFDGKHIVLVDDSEDDAFLTQFMLRGFDPEASFTHLQDPVSARQALVDMIGNDLSPTDMVILLDIMMPIKDGFAVLEDLRADDDLKKIPVIMLSSSEAGGDIFKALKSGADGYLSKPYDVHAMYKAFKNISKKDGRHIPNLIEAS